MSKKRRRHREDKKSSAVTPKEVNTARKSRDEARDLPGKYRIH
jgi:hypothetical protein